ncbi:MAG: hypothetical protein MOB07_13060 [Acidobacteria bacterium]|nr:hypothetical protein [Acidobacteriota bacterium]
MNQTLRKGFRFSYVTLGVSVAALVVSFAFATVLGVWREREQTPRLAVDSMVKALRAHHKRTGRFPSDFRELEARVWKHGKTPDFGADGRTLSVANYFYLYHLVDASAATIWIIPTGPRRDEGSTHFLLLTPDNLRRWKGAPLSLDEIRNLPPVPQYRQMAVFGMTEQRPIELSGRK